MTLNSSEDVLYGLACECEGLFWELDKASPTTKVGVTTIELYAEFQQRFSIWAEYLGVFARRSQCLDTRLRNHPDLQDLVARLLDILRRSLQQCKVAMNSEGELDQAPTSFDQPCSKVSPIQTATLTAIDTTLARLNRLGVTIRRSSRDKIDTRARIFAASLDLKPFADLCANAVQALYPGAHQSLKDHLIKSMTDRYARMLHLDSRHENLKTRRQPPIGLSTIPEAPDHETQTNAQPARTTADFINFPRRRTAPSQSDLSSLNTQQIRGRLRLLDKMAKKLHKTSSVQVNQGNYPRPPAVNERSHIFTCEWCSEMLSTKTLSEREWCQHIDRDLEPYICLSDECHQGHAIYPTFDKWFEHMGEHSWRWHQKVYLSSTWVCTVCEFNPDVYSNPQALYSHLRESHDDHFTGEQLRVISRQSKTQQSRAWSECLLCCFTVEEQEDMSDTMFPKRRKGPSNQEITKSARSTRAMTNPGHHNSEPYCSDTSSDSENMGSYRHKTPQRKSPSESVAQHIAAHLQVLMLLTLRFADLQKDDGVFDVDIKSDSVDIDNRDSASKSNDLGRLSDISSEADITKKDMGDEDKEGGSMDLDDDIVGDVTPIPDTDFDLSNVPRQYDDLVAENDSFLKEIIESGAYQSWQDTSTGAGSSDFQSALSNLPADEHTITPILRKLQANLNNSRVLSFDRHSFVPEPTLRDLITQKTIHDILEEQNLGGSHLNELAEEIARDYFRLFAILVNMGEDKYITDFVKEEIKDADLPFRRGQSEQHETTLLTTKTGKNINVFRDWDSKDLEILLMKQYRMLVPLFQKGKHYDFSDYEIVPFVEVPPNASASRRRGGFAEVRKVCIFPNHHDLGGSSTYERVYLADKKLHDPEDFEPEHKVYHSLGPSFHPSIIEPMFTYQREGNYHLVFPWADGTLKEFWECDPRPQLTLKLIKWSLEQMAAITSGLESFHEFTSPAIHTTDKTCFGRHGDIKAQNILVFRSNCEKEDGLGRLVIADLGLAKIHGRGSPIKKYLDGEIILSPTYSAPDIHQDFKGSRKSDIWSLGCLFLEFITWQHLGYSAIRAFSKLRLDENSPKNTVIRTDSFYLPNGEGVRSSVIQWVQSLKNSTNYSPVTHGLVDLIMTQMIVTNPESRGTSHEIRIKLSEMLSHAQQDDDYLLLHPRILSVNHQQLN